MQIDRKVDVAYKAAFASLLFLSGKQTFALFPKMQRKGAVHGNVLFCNIRNTGNALVSG